MVLTDLVWDYLMDYLNSCKQQTKIGSSYSKWSEIRHGIPQGFILGPLLFNIFINDLLFVIERYEIYNFADDNIFYSCGANLKTVLENLKHDVSKLLYWFKINSLKSNPEKFNSWYSVKDRSINAVTINESDEVELLGLNIDKEPNFSKHIDKLYSNVQYKLHALRWIRKYLISLNIW